MKELYEAIVTRLTEEVPALKMIDFEMGQLDALAIDERPAVKFPCALLDISYPQCEDESQHTQLVTAHVNVKLAFECPLPTDSLAPSARRAASLAIFDGVDNVYKFLQGFESDEFSSFSRKSQSPDNRYAGIKIINMLFETTFEDITAYQV
jgi:hypothetical protein